MNAKEFPLTALQNIIVNSCFKIFPIIKVIRANRVHIKVNIPNNI